MWSAPVDVDSAPTEVDPAPAGEPPDSPETDAAFAEVGSAEAPLSDGVSDGAVFVDGGEADASGPSGPGASGAPTVSWSPAQ